MDFSKFDLFFNPVGTQKTVAEVNAIDRAIGNIEKSAKGTFATLARVLGSSVNEAVRLQQALDIKPGKLAQVANLWKNLASEGQTNNQKFQALNKTFGITAEQFAKLDNAMMRYQMGAAQSASTNQKFGEGLGTVAFKFNQIVQLLGTVLSAAKPVYDYLIGSNEELNQQILATQTNLASVADIKVGSQILKDSDAILAARERVSKSIKQLEKDTVDLVGITTQDTQKLYQITLQSAKQLAGQFKGMGDNVDLIRSAEMLTKGWAAALGTIGIPLFQAREEINSILRGNITNNSQLAKTLGITNAMVGDWKKQGTLVKELTDRFQIFVEGNKLAAKTITGITSNIRDLFQIMGREAGSDLIEPLTEGLDKFYQQLKTNQETLVTYFKSIVKDGGKIVSLFGDALKPALVLFYQNTQSLLVTMGKLLTFLGRVSEVGSQAFQAINAAIIPVIKSVDLANISVERIVNAFNLLSDLEAAQAIDSVVQGNERLYDETTQVVNRLKELNALQRQNGTLSKAQATELASLEERGRSLIESYNAQNKTLKSIQSTRAEDNLKVQQAVKSNESYLQAIQSTSAGMSLLEKTQLTNRDNWENIKAKIDGNITSLEGLNSNTEDYQVLSEDLINLIKKKAQFTGQATEQELNALRAISNATGADLELRKSAKDAVISLENDKTKAIVDNYKTQKISAVQAINLLSEIKSNANNELEVRQDASNALVGIIKDQQEQSLQIYKDKETEIQALLATGYISEITAEKKLTENKLAEIQARIEKVRELKSQENDPAKLAVYASEEKKLQSDLTKIRLEYAKKEVQNTIEGYNQKLQALQTQYEAQLISEKEFAQKKYEINTALINKEIQQQEESLSKLGNSETQAREKIITKIQQLEAEKRKIQIDYEKANLNVIIEANRKAEDALEASLSHRTALAKKAQLDRLKAGQSVTDAEKATEDEVRAITEQSLNDRIALTRNALAQIARLKAEGFTVTQDLIDKEKALNETLAQLNLEAIDREIEAVKRLRETRVQAVQDSFGATIDSLQVQSDLLEQINESYGIQNSLISAQSGLQGAMTQLLEQRYQTAIKIAKEAGNDVLAARLQNELYQKQLESLRNQYELKVQEEQINRVIRENAAQMALLQAEMNKLKAEEALLTAQINEDNEAKINLLQKQLELSNKAVENARSNVEAQKEISDITERRMKIEQTIAEERIREDQRAFNAETKRQQQAEKSRQEEERANELKNQQSQNQSGVVPNQVIGGTVLPNKIYGDVTQATQNLDKATTTNTAQMGQLTDAIKAARSTPTGNGYRDGTSLVYYDTPGRRSSNQGIAGLYANQTNVINLNNVVDPYSTVTKQVQEMTQQIKATQAQ